MSKVFDLFSKKELNVEDLIPTPREELLSIMNDVKHSLKYHQIMSEYAIRILNIINEIDRGCNDKLTWADIGPILDEFENLIDVSKPDHKAVIGTIFEETNDYNNIQESILKEIMKREVK